jgi:hypothetical protein
VNFTISQRSLQSSLQNREIRSHPLSMPQLPAVACARLIVAHLCRRRQWFTPNAPSRGVDRTRGLLVQRQTPLIGQPSQRRTAATSDPSHVLLRGVIGGGTAIVSVEQDRVQIGRRTMPTLGGTLKIIVSPVFHEPGFDPGKEASLRISETG